MLPATKLLYPSTVMFEHRKQNDRYDIVILHHQVLDLVFCVVVVELNECLYRGQRQVTVIFVKVISDNPVDRSMEF